jgi:hypothetical protein
MREHRRQTQIKSEGRQRDYRFVRSLQAPWTRDRVVVQAKRLGVSARQLVREYSLEHLRHYINCSRRQIDNASAGNLLDSSSALSKTIKGQAESREQRHGMEGSYQNRLESELLPFYACGQSNFD